MNRILPTIDDSGPYIPLGQRQQPDIGFSFNREDGKQEYVDYLEPLENEELREDKNEIQSDEKVKSDQEDKPQSQYTRFIRGEKFTDQLAQYRTDYRIPFDLGADDRQIWKNHEGTKLVVLSSKIQDSKTILTFKLYDNQYRELHPFQIYQLEREINISSFMLSNDEKYLLIQDGDNQFYSCYLQNGFEDDVFIDRKYGEDSLLSMKIFQIDTKISEYRISISNHLFIQVYYQIYKSKLTLREFMNKLQSNKNELHLDDDFGNDQFEFLDIQKIDGPFIVGID